MEPVDQSMQLKPEAVTEITHLLDYRESPLPDFLLVTFSLTRVQTSGKFPVVGGRGRGAAFDPAMFRRRAPGAKERRYFNELHSQ
jgi:hypothetical protein